MNAATATLLALLPAALAACAGPDDRAPSSPVAGSYGAGALRLDLEPDGGLRLADAHGGTWLRGAHRVDGDVLVLEAYTPARSELASCARPHDAARYRLLRIDRGLRLVPLADACLVRMAAVGGRAWTRLR